MKAEVINPNSVNDILFPEKVNSQEFGTAQSKLTRTFLIERGADSKSVTIVIT